jgi:hypothetical protein
LVTDLHCSLFSLPACILLIAALMSAPANGDDGSGMKASASVDATGSFHADKKSRSTNPTGASDRFDVREAEFMFYGPVDHLFDGILSVAAHQEDGAAFFEIHEAHISSSKLIPRSRLKAGQFFLGIGRLNRFHRHEWPFVTAPKVQSQFFGDEGVLDSGVEYSYLAPLPFFLDLTFGLTNGWVYGHSHSEGEKPRKPTHYIRAGTYTALPGGGGAQTGFNWLARTAADQEKTVLTGLDFVGKWRQAATLDYLLQAEVWVRTRTPAGQKPEETVGAYMLPQAALSPAVTLGVRADYYTVRSLKDAAGAKVKNSDYALVPTLTWKPSEFSTLRLAVTHGVSQVQDNPDSVSRRVEIQTNFMLGAHPAHDF